MTQTKPQQLRLQLLRSVYTTVDRVTVLQNFLMLTVTVTVIAALTAFTFCFGCEREFVKYYPSPFEEDWVKNVETYQKDVCNQILKREQFSKFERWLQHMESIDDDIVAGKSCGKFRQEVETELDDIFSKFEYRYFCQKRSNPLHGQVRNESIEPLVGFLRDPRPLCRIEKKDLNLGKRNDNDKRFILMSDAHCLDLTSPPRLIIQDLGSTTYLFSKSGPSQQYFVDRYRALGYTNLHRLMAWEAIPYPKVKGVYDQVPADVMPHYQFFNVPITAAEGDKYNPLTLLKQIARRKDFVAFKLDVDSSEIEFGLIKQILGDEELLGLIDEFYFEHHSTIAAMAWAWKTQASGSLAYGFQLFRRLREKGVRAHSWI